VDNVQKDEHQRVMTGRPCRRRYPLKTIETDDKKGRTEQLVVVAIAVPPLRCHLAYQPPPVTPPLLLTWLNSGFGRPILRPRVFGGWSNLALPLYVLRGQPGEAILPWRQIHRGAQEQAGRLFVRTYTDFGTSDFV
jgi:hypothetical protein